MLELEILKIFAINNSTNDANVNEPLSMCQMYNVQDKQWDTRDLNNKYFYNGN